MIQKYVEEIESIFKNIGRTQVLFEVDLAQKELNEEAEYLQAVGQLSSPSTNTGWSLPSGFISLEDIWFYDADGNPKYPGDFNYGHEIVNNKLYIYSLTSTTITGLDSSISTAYILYNSHPDSITGITDDFDLPSEFHQGIMARVYQKLYMKYPVEQVINGQVIKSVNPSMARMWNIEYESYRKKLKKSKYKDNTHVEPIFYPYAGKFELPRRVKDISSASLLPAISTLYNKYARWTLTYPSTVTEVVAPTGYTGTLTAVISSNQLIITSTSSDFTSISDWNSNQDDVLINTFEEDNWIFDLPTGNWGTMRMEIFE